MAYDQGKNPLGNMVVVVLIILNVVIIKAAFVGNEKWYWMLFITMPLLFLAQTVNTLKRVIKTWQKRPGNLLKFGIQNITKFSVYSNKTHLSSQVVKSDGRIHQKL